MKGGWLEHEIRSLPQVLACSVSGDDVVVMVQPSADPAAVQLAVADVLQRHGRSGRIRVYGGVRPAFVEPLKVRNGRRGLIGSVGGAAVLAAGVWIAGTVAGLRSTKPHAPLAAPAEPSGRAVVLIPEVGGPPPSNEPLPAQETNTWQLLHPVHRPVLQTGNHQGKRNQGSPSRAPAPATQPAPEQPAPSPQPKRGLLDPLLALTGPRLTSVVQRLAPVGVR